MNSDPFPNFINRYINKMKSNINTSGQTSSQSSNSDVSCKNIVTDFDTESSCESNVVFETGSKFGINNILKTEKNRSVNKFFTKRSLTGHSVSKQSLFQTTLLKNAQKMAVPSTVIARISSSKVTPNSFDNVKQSERFKCDYSAFSNDSNMDESSAEYQEQSFNSDTRGFIIGDTRAYSSSDTRAFVSACDSSDSCQIITIANSSAMQQKSQTTFEGSASLPAVMIPLSSGNRSVSPGQTACNTESRASPKSNFETPVNEVSNSDSNTGKLSGESCDQNINQLSNDTKKSDRKICISKSVGIMESKKGLTHVSPRKQISLILPQGSIKIDQQNNNAPLILKIPKFAQRKTVENSILESNKQNLLNCKSSVINHVSGSNMNTNIDSTFNIIGTALSCNTQSNMNSIMCVSKENSLKYSENNDLETTSTTANYSDDKASETTLTTTKYKSGTAAAFLDQSSGLATVLEGAEVVRSVAVSYATPIMHQVFLQSSPFNSSNNACHLSTSSLVNADMIAIEEENKFTIETNISLHDDRMEQDQPDNSEVQKNIQSKNECNKKLPYDNEIKINVTSVSKAVHSKPIKNLQISQNETDEISPVLPIYENPLTQHSNLMIFDDTGSQVKRVTNMRLPNIKHTNLSSTKQDKLKLVDAYPMKEMDLQSSKSQKMFVCKSPTKSNESTEKSCPVEITLEMQKKEEDDLFSSPGDDELKPLSWLQNADLFNNGKLRNLKIKRRYKRAREETPSTEILQNSSVVPPAPKISNLQTSSKTSIFEITSKPPTLVTSFSASPLIVSVKNSVASSKASIEDSKLPNISLDTNSEFSPEDCKLSKSENSSNNCFQSNSSSKNSIEKLIGPCNVLTAVSSDSETKSQETVYSSLKKSVPIYGTNLIRIPSSLKLSIANVETSKSGKTFIPNSFVGYSLSDGKATSKVVPSASKYSLNSSSTYGAKQQIGTFRSVCSNNIKTPFSSLKKPIPKASAAGFKLGCSRIRPYNQRRMSLKTLSPAEKTPSPAEKTPATLSSPSLSSYTVISASKHKTPPKLCSPTSDYGEDSFEDPFRGEHPATVFLKLAPEDNSKPPYSFSSLIFFAIEASTHKALPVKAIYAWVVRHFPYFRTAPSGWKNSVRHNLSLSKCFKKVDKTPVSNLGKGSLWMVDPSHKDNLIRSLTKVHPHAPWEKIYSQTPTEVGDPLPSKRPLDWRPLESPSDGKLSFLANRFPGSSGENTALRGQPTIARQPPTTSTGRWLEVEAVTAAHAMLTLKRGGRQDDSDHDSYCRTPELLPRLPENSPSVVLWGSNSSGWSDGSSNRNSPSPCSSLTPPSSTSKTNQSTSSPTSSVDEAFSDASFESDAGSSHSDYQEMVDGADALLNFAARASEVLPTLVHRLDADETSCAKPRHEAPRKPELRTVQKLNQGVNGNQVGITGQKFSQTIDSNQGIGSNNSNQDRVGQKFSRGQVINEVRYGHVDESQARLKQENQRQIKFQDQRFNMLHFESKPNDTTKSKILNVDVTGSASDTVKREPNFNSVSSPQYHQLNPDQLGRAFFMPVSHHSTFNVKSQTNLNLPNAQTFQHSSYRVQPSSYKIAELKSEVKQEEPEDLSVNSAYKRQLSFPDERLQKRAKIESETKETSAVCFGTNSRSTDFVRMKLENGHPIKKMTPFKHLKANQRRLKKPVRVKKT